jgi:hypothetical protein
MKRQLIKHSSNTVDKSTTNEAAEQVASSQVKRFKSTDITLEHQPKNNDINKKQHDSINPISLTNQRSNTEIEGELAIAIDLILSHRIHPKAICNGKNTETTLPRLFIQHQLYITSGGPQLNISNIDATDIDRTTVSCSAITKRI